MLAKSGMAVCVVGIDQAEVESLVQEITAAGSTAIGVTADLTDMDQCDAAFAECARELGTPTSVVAECEGYDPRIHGETFPKSSKITYESVPPGTNPRLMLLRGRSW